MADEFGAEDSLDSDAPDPSAFARATQQIPSEMPSDGFVGSGKCKQCHEQEFSSWHASYHRRMTQVASSASVLGQFEGRVTAYGETFTLERKGGEFWVTSECLAAKDAGAPAGSAAPVVEKDLARRRVVMTTGSHHMQVYWFAAGPDKRLAQLPIAWLRETQSWVPTTSLFISPPPQPLKLGLQRWNEVCIKCHTTHGQPRISNIDTDATRVETQVAEFGIACEACHGPGADHVQRHLSGHSALEGVAIVHPAKVGQHRSAEICGQCHGNWIPDSEDGLSDYLARGTCFRAGDSLTEDRHVFGVESPDSQFIDQFLAAQPHYLEDRYWPDGMIRVSGGEYNGMVKSACFGSSELTCLTCHQMHKQAEDPRSFTAWANDQMRHDRLGSEACLSCHAEYRSEEKLTAHTHHPALSAGSDCLNCHMPHTSYGLLKAIRSHQVSIPTAQESQAWGRPNACNLCHLDQTLEWSAKHLEEWYDIEPPESFRADEKNYSAAYLWALTGDAGQRALAAWSMGWLPAQEASRMDSVPCVLAQLLADPYDAVRHIAHRSLKTFPEYRDFKFDYVGPVEERHRAAIRAFQRWQHAPRRASAGDKVILLTPTGKLNSGEFTRLNHSRNNRQVLLAE